LRVLLLASEGASDLRQCAYDVTQVGSPAEALTAWRTATTPFDVLLVDSGALMGPDAGPLREQIVAKGQLPTVMLAGGDASAANTEEVSIAMH
jgi:hypothetical protein